MHNIILGISGSSGIIYAEKLIDFFVKHNILTTVIFSKNAPKVIESEFTNGILNKIIRIKSSFPVQSSLPEEALRTHYSETPKLKKIDFYFNDEISAPIASGSVHFSHMIVLPCSMGCLGRIAHGLSTGLLERVADVSLKERRSLILVPRETPLHRIHLENMLTLSTIGATILPATPAFYFHPQSIDELVTYVVERILAHIGLLESDKQRVKWEASLSAENECG